ncbi:IclR family transcriptional regulator [Paenibacillus oryzisoli]|uniref:IclR family transcriptional regulator n=1 Tax=Paenibacillus oryzisoli TaxID=1850517 RepID=UPI003D2D3733
MDKKYWVPALERAQEVLKLLAEQPSKLKLTDLSAATQINKSTMFSLLHTMEALNWVVKEKGDTYSLGAMFGLLGNAYFTGMSLVKLFTEKAEPYVARIGETLQMAKLEQGDIVYLAKKEASLHVRLISEPGMRLPAYATAMGKMLLAQLPDERVEALYAGGAFEAFTPHTVRSCDELLAQLHEVRRTGLAIDREEIVQGFCCVAAPVRGRGGDVTAAVSTTMPMHQWAVKQGLAAEAIRQFALELSAAI